MKITKQLLSIAICILIVLSMFNAAGAAAGEETTTLDLRVFASYAEKARSAFTESVVCNKIDEVKAQASSVRFHYVTQGQEAMISGVENCPAVLEIPQIIDGYKVVSIGDEAFRGQNIYSLELPETVIYIGRLAFAECKNLEYVVMPDSLRQIDYDAFMACSHLQYVGTGIYQNGHAVDVDVCLPSALNYLGLGAFSYCEALVGMIMREGVQTLQEYVFAGCKSMELLVTYADTIERRAFGNASVDQLMLFNVLKSVHRGAFENAQVLSAAYSGSKEQFNKCTKNLSIPGEFYALGADVRYKTSGKISDVLDSQIVNEIREYSVLQSFSSANPDIVQIASDGDSYTALRVGTARLRHPYLEEINEYADPNDEFPDIPAYVTVSYSWWQQLIRIFLLGFIWY